ncbi:DUF1801 domain-containing protein [Anoxybacillus flavithermus]|uniref:DUF1801 domain-containing protein n=1 Tax=Anoxybacillus flavithermus TaxID=33934 RepID=UPI0003AA9E40
MEVFEQYLAKIDHVDHRNRVEEILRWVCDTFPQLQPQIKWNTPTFTTMSLITVFLQQRANSNDYYSLTFFI